MKKIFIKISNGTNYIFKNKIKLLGLVFFLGFFIVVQSALAEITANRIYFQSPVSVIAPGSEFIVNVYLDAKDPINAFDLEIIYPLDTLKFLNFDNTDSLVDIWQPKPALSSDGHIKLSCAIIKAFNSGSGLLIKLAFEALNANKSEISFIKSNLYIADGKGTEVKAETQNFSISIQDDGEVVHSSAISFKETPSNIIIEKELRTLEKKATWKETTPWLFLAIILFVICGIIVYNKIKRKL